MQTLDALICTTAFNLCSRVVPRCCCNDNNKTTVSERICAGTEKGAPVGEGEESKADRDSNDNSEMTCRICLSNYKVSSRGRERDRYRDRKTQRQRQRQRQKDAEGESEGEREG